MKNLDICPIKNLTDVLKLKNSRIQIEYIKEVDGAVIYLYLDLLQKRKFKVAEC